VKTPTNNIYIRNLSEIDKEIVSELKAHFRVNTSTQVALRSMRNYKRLLDRLSELEGLAESLSSENNELKSKIDNIKNSFKDLQG
jgi:peptidoglycan hydrolase CwlO-like protein